METFAQRLYDLRTDKEISQAELARQIGIDNTTVSSWEREETTPTLPMLILLRKFFGVSIDDLGIIFG